MIGIEKKHIDDRGFFQELYKGNDLLRNITVSEIFDKINIVDEILKTQICSAFSAFTENVKQISIFSINPKKTRGCHYHKLLEKEIFFILSGLCNFKNIGPCNSSNIKTILNCDLTKGEYVYVLPYEQHSFYSENGALILTLSTKEFDPKNPDVYSI